MSGQASQEVAEALALAGDLPGAIARLDEALALAHRISKTLDLSYLNGLKADFETRPGDAEAARAAWRAVVTTARAQGPVGFEMQGLAALCDDPAATADYLAALHRCVDAAPAGFAATLRDCALALLHRA